MAGPDVGEGSRARMLRVCVLDEELAGTHVDAHVELGAWPEGRRPELVGERQVLVRAPLRRMVADVSAHEDELRRRGACPC